MDASPPQPGGAPHSRFGTSGRRSILSRFYVAAGGGQVFRLWLQPIFFISLSTASITHILDIKSPVSFRHPWAPSQARRTENSTHHKFNVVATTRHNLDAMMLTSKHNRSSYNVTQLAASTSPVITATEVLDLVPTHRRSAHLDVTNTSHRRPLSTHPSAHATLACPPPSEDVIDSLTSDTRHVQLERTLPSPRAHHDLEHRKSIAQPPSTAQHTHSPSPRFRRLHRTCTHMMLLVNNFLSFASQLTNTNSSSRISFGYICRGASEMAITTAANARIYHSAAISFFNRCITSVRTISSRLRSPSPYLVSTIVDLIKEPPSSSYYFWAALAPLLFLLGTLLLQLFGLRTRPADSVIALSNYQPVSPPAQSAAVPALHPSDQLARVTEILYRRRLAKRHAAYLARVARVPPVPQAPAHYASPEPNEASMGKQYSHASDTARPPRDGGLLNLPPVDDSTDLCHSTPASSHGGATTSTTNNCVETAWIVRPPHNATPTPTDAQAAAPGGTTFVLSLIHI